MKLLFCCFLLFCFLQIAHAKTISNEQFVRYCNAIYLCDAGIGDYEGPWFRNIKPLSVKARRYMASLSSRQKKNEFKRLSRLPLGRNATESVAYVAACMGMQPYANAHLMLHYVEPPHPLWTNMGGAGENIFSCIWELYDRFHDRRIALLLLEEHSDGAGAAVASSMRSLMLERQPRFILALAMQSKRAFALLSHDFIYGEPDKKDFQVLRRLCHDPDPILRRGARQIRHRVHAEYSARHMPYPAD